MNIVWVTLKDSQIKKYFGQNLGVIRSTLEKCLDCTSDEVSITVLKTDNALSINTSDIQFMIYGDKVKDLSNKSFKRMMNSPRGSMKACDIYRPFSVRAVFMPSRETVEFIVE